MSDEKQPVLTPAEQHKQDEGRVSSQLVVTDVTERVKEVMSLFSLGGGSTAGRTSFEGHELNAIIDLVENSNPADLENAGEALWKARDAIRSAAKELGDHIDGVDWQGESGEAFRNWGKGLVTHATKLGDFADAAGTQITVAGTGLASVRSAMPPRDSRMIQKNPDDILLPARTETNPEYAAALAVEKNRQEAINQVNRLASYYAVSEEVLAGQEPPRFDQELGVDMPKPRERIDHGGSESTSGGGDVPLGDRPQGSSERTFAAAAGSEGSARGRFPVDHLGPDPVLDKSTSTEINSVATPAAPPTTTNTAPAPSVTTGPGPSITPAPPIATGIGNPIPASASRHTGSSGSPRSASQAGGGPAKASPAGGAPIAKGGTATPVGRPSPMAGGPSVAGRPGGGTQPPAAGQSGVMGGRPTAAHGPTAAPGSSRTGQGNGIVGGTPQRATSGASGAGSARGVPRGTVIGGQGAAPAGTSAGRPGQPGVIGGAGGSNTAQRAGQRSALTSGANGVVGAPRGTSGSGSKGFTAGGAGLVRGPAGRRKSDRKDEENTGSARPDYLTEDEETWAARRRGAVPPVVE
ncbi:hypothetical protein [Streptomyces sp. NPDC088755]|uniref:hypothetical protein n=1 Tax=Streptomyces sp. NPDC088755 TaxID=3365888 RepID=UPI0038169293